MKIEKIEIEPGFPPSGFAVSRRGRRYVWSAMATGDVFFAFREDPRSRAPDGKCFWRQVKPHAALRKVVFEAVQKARH